MSYRIEYGPEVPTCYRKKRRSGRLQTMTAVCLLLFALLVRSFFPAGMEKLRQLLLPDVHSVVQAAYTEFMRGMNGGQSIGDAFTVFCQHVIDNEEALRK